jgi:tripartite-type tricarboxylate transporter receptor subunit TctC
MTKMRELFRGVMALAAFVSTALVAQAQDFPTRPITMLVGLAPGGVTDIGARMYADTVSRIIGQRIVVENRPAASGATAAAALQNAAPDGYMLLIFSGSQHATIPAMEASAPYDPVKGAQPITLLFNIATVVTVPTDSPINSFADLLELGKRKADGLTFGSPGVGTPAHLLSAKLMAAAKLSVQFVHYRGGAPMVTDLLGGRLDVATLSTPLGKPYFADKRLKPVAIDAPGRWSLIPDVPTLEELGLRNAGVAGWFGVAAAPGTPPAVVAKLHDAFAASARDPDLKRRIEDTGLTVITSTPDEMGRSMAREAADIAQLVNALGLRRQ